MECRKAPRGVLCNTVVALTVDYLAPREPVVRGAGGLFFKFATIGYSVAKCT